jgi:predicted methyltransferase MtxX (methanogen marker protein 4)
MAQALGRKSEADRWLADAETIRRLIIEKLSVRSIRHFAVWTRKETL